MKPIVALLALSLTAPTFAQKATGDCRASRAQVLSKVMVNYLDNVTTGKINTLIGVSFAGISYLGSKYILRNKPDIQMSGNKDQLSVSADVQGQGAISLGLVQVSTSRIWDEEKISGDVTSEGHESGHSYQSAILGKTYIPLAIVNYIPYVFSDWSDTAYFKIFTESWANSEAVILNHSCGGVTLDVGGGHLDVSGETANVISLRFSLDDRGEVTTKEFGNLILNLIKSYEWLKTDVLIPTDKASKLSRDFQFSVLEKNVKVTKPVMNIKGVDVGLVVLSKQNYGKVSNDQAIGRTTVTALEGTLSGGVEARRDNVAFTATYGQGRAQSYVQGGDSGQEKIRANAQSLSYNNISLSREQQTKTLVGGTTMKQSTVGVSVKVNKRISVNANQETRQYDTNDGQKKKKKQLKLGGSVTL